MENPVPGVCPGLDFSFSAIESLMIKIKRGEEIWTNKWFYR